MLIPVKIKMAIPLSQPSPRQRFGRLEEVGSELNMAHPGSASKSELDKGSNWHSNAQQRALFGETPQQ